jgi:MFS family permease
MPSLGPLDRFWCARAASFIGDGFATVTLAFAALELGASPGELGLVLMASRLPYVACMLLGGLVGDRFSRIRILVAADVFRFVVQTVTAFLLINGSANLLTLAVLQGLASATTAFFEPAADATLADIVPERGRQRANSLLGLLRGLGMVIGPGIAGGLVAVGGVGAAFAVDAVTFAVSGALIASIGLTAQQPRTGETFLTLARDGWAAFRSRTWLWLSTAVMMLINGLCVAPVLALGPLVATKSMDAIASWGSVMAVFAVGGLIGGLIGVRWQPKHPLAAAMVLAALFLGPFPLALSVPAPTAVVAIAAGVTGAQATLFNTFVATSRQNHVPACLRSRMASLSTVSALAALPLGMAAAGVSAEMVGTRHVLLAAAILAVVVPLAGLRSTTVRTLPPAPAPNVALKGLT